MRAMSFLVSALSLTPLLLCDQVTAFDQLVHQRNSAVSALHIRDRSRSSLWSLLGCNARQLLTLTRAGHTAVRDAMAQDLSINTFDLSVRTLDSVVEALDQSVRRIMLEAAHSCKREEVIICTWSSLLVSSRSSILDSCPRAAARSATH